MRKRTTKPSAWPGQYPKFKIKGITKKNGQATIFLDSACTISASGAHQLSKKEKKKEEPSEILIRASSKLLKAETSYWASYDNSGCLGPVAVTARKEFRLEISAEDTRPEDDLDPTFKLVSNFPMQFASLQLFNDSACGVAASDLYEEGSATAYNLKKHGTYSFYYEAIDENGNASACLGPVSYHSKGLLTASNCKGLNSDVCFRVGGLPTEWEQGHLQLFSDSACTSCHQ